MVWLTTGEGAELVDVHQSSIKRWCDECRLACTYTDGGHRRIALSDLMALAREEGLDCRLLVFGDRAEGVYRAVGRARTSDEYGALVDLAYSWLQASVDEGLGELFRFMIEQDLTLSDICDRVIGPLLSRIGDDWRAGTAAIGDEHRMFYLIEEGFHHLRSGLLQNRDRTADRPLALVSCGDGNQHAMGALMVRLCLEMGGVRTVYLGPRLPAPEIAGQQRKLDASIVCISMPRPNVGSDVDRTLRQLARLYDEDTPYRVLFGGKAVGEIDRLDREAFPFPEIALLESIGALETWLQHSLHVAA